MEDIAKIAANAKKVLDQVRYMEIRDMIMDTAKCSIVVAENKIEGIKIWANTFKDDPDMLIRLQKLQLEMLENSCYNTTETLCLSEIVRK